MKRFAELFQLLDRSTGTLAKRAAMVGYFQQAPAEDAVWALWLLAGNKLTAARARIANSTELRAWAGAACQLPDWLVDESYHHVGDLAETLALLLQDPAAQDVVELPLHVGIEQQLLPVAGASEAERQAAVRAAWRGLPFWQRLLFNKLLTGALRVGVSQRLVQQALAEYSGIDIARIAQRMLGAWQPSTAFWHALLSPDALPSDRTQPYPFFLASPLEVKPGDGRESEEGSSVAAQPDVPAAVDAVAHQLGAIGDWLLEWKWDGIRLQLIRRAGEVAMWSRGEERLDGRFPEIEAAARQLPVQAVIDGELLVWNEPQAGLAGEGTAALPWDDAAASDASMGGAAPAPHQSFSLVDASTLPTWAGRPAPFTALQKRIQRRQPGAKLLAQAPARLLAYDLLELEGCDLRDRPLAERRARLQALLAPLASTAPDAAARLMLSPRIDAATWAQAAVLRDQARARGVEGVMLKRLSSSYQSGRRRGDWWKWKVDPLTIDAVLLYAQAGHGRRSNLFTDYTFGVWDGDQLVPVAKAYSGLTDREIGALDRWIRAHTIERFGPVRSVQAVQVFELAFEGVNRSSRHKSGVAVRFPRILRWRTDKPAAEADRLSALQALAA